jgi:hypothetical protein
MPKVGLQALEEKLNKCNVGMYNINTNYGFCVAWSMFYIEQRVSNPTKTRKQIIDGIMKYVSKGEMNENVCILVRNFSGFIIKIYKDKSLLDKLKFNIEHLKYFYIQLGVIYASIWSFLSLYIFGLDKLAKNEF